MSILSLSFFHVYYFTCCIVEFRLFAFLLILRLLLCLLRRILLILGLRTLCRRNHFSLYCLFWLFFIFITLIRWTRELLLWSISPLNPSILLLLFFVLCNLQNNWLLLLLWFPGRSCGAASTGPTRRGCCSSSPCCQASSKWTCST